MGGISAMHSIQRFIDKHEADLVADCLTALPPAIAQHGPRILLANEVHRIDVYATWDDPQFGKQELQLAGMDIDTAIGIDESSYGDDCQMGY